MKKVIRLVTVAAFLMIAPVILLAQTPPHPNGGADPISGGNQPVGGGAPIDGGLSIMLVLGAAYGAKKVYKLKK